MRPPKSKVLEAVRVTPGLTAHYTLLKNITDENNQLRNQVMIEVCFITGMEQCQEEARDRWGRKVK
jgi:hypothetical protein